MRISSARTRRLARRTTGAATAAIVALGLVSMAPTAQGKDGPALAASDKATVHREAGKPLAKKSNETPAARVKAYLKGRGLADATLGSLRVDGKAWKSRGVAHLQLEQEVAGLRVYGTYARAAFDADGRLVDLIENVAAVPKGAPVNATVHAADALRTAVAALYPDRIVAARIIGRTNKTATFPKDGWYVAPTVEQVAVPTTDGGLAEAYVVTTWTDGDNELVETLVSGDGEVVETVNRTAEDSYNVFEESPDVDRQKTVRNPARSTSAPGEWLFGSANNTQDIAGNNVHAYVDRDADNTPDGGGTATGVDFLADLVATQQPTTEQNKDVSVQNLFYLNNLIHDTLWQAGFTEMTGNFQEENLAPGGSPGDSVNAETLDGSGTDNANFATPKDGQNPRMQMYLWSVPGMYKVTVAGNDYDAANAEWGAPVTEAGLTAPLSVATDAVGPVGDACEPITTSLSGSIAVVDRGACDFVLKARNVQNAGAVGVIVANNSAAPPVPMGGADRKVTIPGLMVSQADGVTLKGLAGQSATMRLNPAAIMKDSSLDADIVWHEYGHGLTWRMIGRMDGPLAGAIGEGMSDVLAVIVNDDDVVGEYSATDPAGIRSHPYDDYDRSYGDIFGEGVHLDGEVYGAIGWRLSQLYADAGLGDDELLADLVDGMNYTPAQPTYEQMRDGILASLANLESPTARSCMVWDAFAEYGVGMGASGTVRGARVLIDESYVSGCGTTFPDKPGRP